MADKTIKHFIFVQFFNWQNPKYPHDVWDVDFLSTQLPLTRNVLTSLENQTNKNFEIYFYTNPKLFADEKYKFVFSALQDSTVLPLKIIKPGERNRLIKDALNEYDFVIQSRIDFDDFIFKDSIKDTQSKIDECDKMLVYGYCKGYRYVYGELYPYYNLWHGNGHLGILQSFILKSSWARKMPLMVINNFYHDKFKPMLEEFLKKNEIELEISEEMFRQNTSTDAFIYYGHEFSQEQLTKNFGNPLMKLSKKKSLTTEDITKKQLEDEFGFYLDLKSIK